MLKKKAFIKKTKKGNLVKVVREHYLRDDIKSGTRLDPDCEASESRLSSEAACYLIVDTNVALHQIDFLEHPAVEDVIVPSIVLQEVRHRNRGIYDRLRLLTDDASQRRFFVFQNEHHRSTYITQESGESDNDRNDRAIRVAAKWYADLLAGKMEVLLLTDDVENRYKAETEFGLKAQSVLSYAKSRTDCKELYDIAQIWAQECEMDIDGDEEKSKKQCRRAFYTEHKPMSELKSGIQQGLYHQGILEMSRNCWYCGTVESNLIIKIVGIKHINRAVAGDVVAVRLLDKDPEPTISDSEEEEETGGAETAGQEMGSVPVGDSGALVKYPLGEVVGIIKQNWRAHGYCGSLKPPKSSGTRSGHFSRAVFKPKARMYPAVVIRTAQLQELLGKRIVVAIDSWPADSRLPQGHYVRKLGDSGNKETETEVLLLEHDINTNPFTPSVHSCVPSLPWSVPLAEYSDPNRRDLRHLCVCSIDPPGCKDIDDAVHVQLLPSGNYEIGVHIADVTYFVLQDTPLDGEAARRSTTVYLVEKAISMLPRALTEEICSLKSGVDRLTFSVLWTVSPTGEFLAEESPVFTKSIIRSHASLSYAEAQSRIDDARLQDELTCNLRILNRLGKTFRQRRKELGALELASSEVKFQLDSETQDPTDIAMYQTLDTNRMVEEMMLLANKTVAEKILEKFPQIACLRRHPSPNLKRFEPILSALETKELQLDLTTNKTLAESLDKAMISNDPYFNTLLRMMVTRCMNEAQYFASGEHSPSDYYHYGLAMELYTHFTSPIRRYADVVVHRLLSMALDLGSKHSMSLNLDHMKELTRNMNICHRNAQLASRASASLYTLVFFRHKKIIADGRITGFTGVKSTGLTVCIQKYGIEGPVFTLSDEKDSRKEPCFHIRSPTEVESKTGLVYSVFDRVKVVIEVYGKDNYDEELVLSLVESKP